MKFIATTRVPTESGDASVVAKKIVTEKYFRYLINCALEDPEEGGIVITFDDDTGKDYRLWNIRISTWTDKTAGDSTDQR